MTETISEHRKDEPLLLEASTKVRDSRNSSFNNFRFGHAVPMLAMYFDAGTSEAKLFKFWSIITSYLGVHVHKACCIRSHWLKILATVIGSSQP